MPRAIRRRASGAHPILDDQLDVVAAAGKDELSPRPAVGMATRRTRSQVTVETLDDDIAELIYGEDLPDKSSSSTSCVPFAYGFTSHQSVVG